MLTKPDFKERKIVFVKAQKDIDTMIKFGNSNVVFIQGGDTINKMSCYKILCIFLIGDTSITTVLIKNLKKYGISLFMLKNNFSLYASVNSIAEGNYQLRSNQYRYIEKMDLSKKVVINKISNQLRLLLLSKKINKTVFTNKVNKYIRKINKSKTNAELMGIEGSCSREFFKLYFEALRWKRRIPRVKSDIYNLLLDMGYTHLFNYIDTVLCLFGFDCYKGFYHQLFFQRKSLVCDIIEPFRSIIDKTLLKMYNLKQINEEDFRVESGRYILEYDKSTTYSKIFSEEIMRYNEKIYDYIHEFYYLIMKNNEKCPEFIIK